MRPPNEFILYKGQRISAWSLSQRPECEISPSLVYKNLSEGMSAEEAIKRKRKVNIPYKGKMYSLGGILNHPDCVVSRYVLKERLKSKKWSIEAAITTPKRAYVQRTEKLLEPIPFSILEAEAERKRHQEEKEAAEQAEKERKISIFQVPVNPNKCRYTKGGW